MSQRLLKEFGEMEKTKHQNILKVRLEKEDLLHWIITLRLIKHPYNLRIKIDYPKEYPHVDPKVTLLTSMDEDGLVFCHSLSVTKGWTPKSTILMLVESVVKMLDYPVRFADEYIQARENFLKHAGQNFLYPGIVHQCGEAPPEPMNVDSYDLWADDFEAMEVDTVEGMDTD